MYGIYARQSVEKRDSISIEMQIDLCRRMIPEKEETMIYADPGYTGTNLKRPAFQQMLVEIRKGRLRGIVVYKLDRISRSLSDFARLSEELERHHVKLISYGERFDTGSPMGMMLVRMLIMFAEMEQKTISARIKDNYYARAEMKKALGGTPPYGFEKDWTADAAKSHVVFSLFQQTLCGKSLDRVAQTLNQQQISSPKGKRWTGMQISRILRNPAYVKSNAAVYTYFQRKGAQMLHPAEDYCKGSGCLAIQKGEVLCIAAGSHSGIISAELWLSVQELLDQRKPSANGGSGETSWMQGLVLCGYCGESCYVRSNSAGMPYVYFVCRGKRLGICRGLKAIRTQPIENQVGQILQTEMQRILSEHVTVEDPLVLRSHALDQETEELLCMMQENPHAAADLRHRLEEVYQQRNQLHSQVQRSFHKFSGKEEILWKTLTLEQKKAIAQLLVKKVLLTQEQITLILH